MPYIKIWIHLIFSTKNRQKIISKELKKVLMPHIKGNSIKKNIYIDFMNCVEDHFHSLISMRGNQSISNIAQLIKGESSHWINENKLIPTKFEWQNDYIAVSVSESNVNIVREYIKNQEEHHRKKSFMDEYNEIIKKYGFGKT